MTHFIKNAIPVFLITGLCSAILLMASVPPVSRDALTHHLAVPKLYVNIGKIVELPDIIPSYYPQLLDLLYCIPLLWGNDIIPKYIHFSFALLTAWLIYTFVRKRLDHVYALWASLFFISLPVIVKLSVTVYVDLGLIFFSFSSLLALLKWKNKAFSLKWLIVSGVFCGLAMGTKYNGIITCFILSAFTPLIFLRTLQSDFRKEDDSLSYKLRRHRTFIALGYSLCFFLTAMIVFSPWMIKNYKWTGNPIYPLYNEHFSSIKTDSIQNSTVSHFSLRKVIYKEKWWETASIPIRIFFQGQDDQPVLFDGQLNSLLFFLPLAVILKPLKRQTHGFELKVFLCFAIIFILAVYLKQDMRIRYIGPALPCLVVASTFGVKQLISFKGRRHWQLRNISIVNIIIGATMALLFSANFFYTKDLFKKIAPLEYLSGRISRHTYIETHRPEYNVLVYANKHLNGDIKLLGFFLGNRRYYSDHPINFDWQGFRRLIKNPKTLCDIHSAFKGYSHFIIFYPKFNQWVASEFTDTEKIRFIEFINANTKLKYSNGEHGIYEIIDFSCDKP